MQERFFTLAYHVGGTLSANQTFYAELSYPWTIDKIKASASNDSDATLALAGGVTVAATVIGDSGDPAEIDCSQTPISADELVTLTLDYDGASGTAAQDVTIIVQGWVGSGA